MGIWRQRIEGSWLKCTGDVKFSILNLNLNSNANVADNLITAVALKHAAIDFSISRSTIDYGQTVKPAERSGLMYDGVGLNSIFSDPVDNKEVYSYEIDYYFGPSITSKKKFAKSKNYQFKTHAVNFAYVEDRASLSLASCFGQSLASLAFNQPHLKLHNSELNCFKGSLGIEAGWGDLYFFEPPYYASYIKSPMTPTTTILYYYSSPSEDMESGFFSYTNMLAKSAPDKIDGSGITTVKEGTKSVYQAGYAIGGVEINETSWKIQGYSFVSYDNDPSTGDYVGIGITNSYSGAVSNRQVPNKKALKKCVFGKGWYYDDANNEYTWYHRIFADTRLNAKNNPVGGDPGLQESHEGYIENNYIAKYIPFKKFNLSFLYENIRSDAGIKVYLSPTLPGSKPLESSTYKGKLLFPPFYLTQNSQDYSDFLRSDTYYWQTGEVRRGRVSLVSGSSQLADAGLLLSDLTTTFTFADRINIFAPVGATIKAFPNRDRSYDSIRSTTIRDYPAMAISNNIYVDDISTNLREIRINITLRHSYVGDLIINLRSPNGKVINVKAKGSGESFNDLRDITFTTSAEHPKMIGLNWWPGATSNGFIYDPIGLPENISTSTPATGLSYPVKAPWMPAPLNQAYNFNWAQLRILPGLTFQMDKLNGEGGSLGLYDGSASADGAGWSNAIYSSPETIDFRSSVNELKHLLNDDGTFNGTYSLYIKDDSGGDSGMLESWSIELIYKKIYTPILSLTQSDPTNAINQGAAKLQYLFGLEGNQYLFIVGDKLINQLDPNSVIRSGTASQLAQDLRASLKNLKIDGGFHSANNKLYAVNDKRYGVYNSPSSGVAQNLPVIGQTVATLSPTFSDFGAGGQNTFELIDPIENVSYSTYVGTGDLNDPTTMALSGVTSKIGNGKFIAGIWENGAWNSGWRKDESLQEFYNIDQFFSYNRDKTWRFSIFGSKYAASRFSVGDRVSIGNIVAINVNEERKLIRGYFTIVAKTIDSISVEFDSDFPIRRIKIDSEIHRIYVSKNVWLTGAFLNGYFTGIWNNGLFKGFPYITEMFNSHWVDGIFDGGHFYSRKKSVEFANVYMATYKTIKVGLVFRNPHGLTEEDAISISANFGSFGSTKVISVPDDYRVIVDLDWNLSRDPNTYGAPIAGKVTTDISTGLVQNFNFSANNVSSVTSLQSMDSSRIFMYDSWMDVNFDSESAVNIGKPQSTIDNTISSYSYSENNLYGYPTYDILSSDVTFRDSFSGTIRKYRLGSKYKIYQDYIGDAGSFDEHFDITGWATKAKQYPTKTPPFGEIKVLGEQLPTSQSFLNQGWVINKDAATASAISFERTTEALNDEDVVAGKEMKITSVGKGGVLNIQPAYDVPNRTNGTIERLRYTIIKFDLLKSIVPDFIFEDSNPKYTDSSKYQPLIHFNNLNYATRKLYTPSVGYSDKIIDSTYLPVYRNIDHLQTSKNTKMEYFYNKRNLAMSFRGNGLDGRNISEFVIDNLKLYEVDMIPFFQYFNEGNINKSVSIPYHADAPLVEYVENDFSLIDNSIYGLDSFYIYQPTGEVNIQAESAAAAAEAAQLDPVVLEATATPSPHVIPDPIPEDEFGVMPDTTTTSHEGFITLDPYAIVAPSCLVEDTIISMSDGSVKMVQDVNEGDSLKSIFVYGMPDSSDQWGSWSNADLKSEECDSVVKKNDPFEVSSTIRINGVLETSFSHNNVIKRNGQWIIRRSDELILGDILMDDLSAEIEISSLAIVEKASKVYNIELIGSKLYYANGILTHNKGDVGGDPWGSSIWDSLEYSMYVTQDFFTPVIGGRGGDMDPFGGFLI